jgi:hypothetical protein
MAHTVAVGTTRTPRGIATATLLIARRQPALAALTVLMAVSLVVFAAALVVDNGEIAGAPGWLKPAKFAISIGIYGASLAWILEVAGVARWVQWTVAVVTAVGLGAEMAIIGLQAARGTTSHYNNETALDSALFSAMGGLIVFVWLANAVACVALLRSRRLPRPLLSGIRLGLLGSLLSMGIGALMIANVTAAQSSGADADHVGAHTVGGSDGGPGLPVFGWSTEYGDLRPAHFVGLHALQILPLVAWWLGRRRGLGAGQRLWMVRVAGTAYLGLVALLTWQALREQSIVHPDLLTAAAVAALVVATAGAAALVARRRPPALAAPATPAPPGTRPA